MVLAGRRPRDAGDGKNARTTRLTMPHAAALPSTSSSAVAEPVGVRDPPASRRAQVARSGRSRGPPARGRAGRASSRADAASRGSAPPRCRRPSARRSRAGAPRRRRAGTSRGRESASTRTYHVDRRCRSPASERGGGGAARLLRPSTPPASGGEPFPALGAAALEDRAAGAGRHARTEAVLALATAYVGLVGPLHDKVSNTKTAAGRAAARQYRQGSLDEFSTARMWKSRRRKERAQGAFSGGRKHPSEGAVHTCGEPCGT